MKDRHFLILGVLLFAAPWAPLAVGHLTTASDVAEISPATRVIDSENPHRAAFATVQKNTKNGVASDRKVNAVGTGVTFIGAASTYNPYRPGLLEGGKETASGEPYDPIEWTAAIQIDLREKFGGVSYGKQYRPTYALVEGVDKKAIVKINDVGTLKPGRIIDFNEQTMRYFDPTLQRGLIQGIMVTPLVGDDWPTGPIEQASFVLSMR
jgi:peptidoglycan lytic transglycosylase